MSGHSKWATIKRAKEAKDAKKGAVFTKIGNNITIAAKKGGDPEMNFALRIAIDKAKGGNMPKENIERAIKRGTGELGGAQVEELTYEGFGPAKSAFIIETLTDNKNRTAAEIRHIFAKHNGSLGSVAWNFSRQGVVRITKDNAPDDEGFELELIDASADDIQREEEGITILTSIENLQKLKNFLDSKNIKTESAEIEYIAKEEKQVSDDDKAKIKKFIEDLDENEDVNNYYTNINL